MTIPEIIIISLFGGYLLFKAVKSIQSRITTAKYAKEYIREEKQKEEIEERKKDLRVVYFQ